MSAGIGYLSALTGDGGHPASGDDRSSTGGGRAPLRPPRRVFGAADFSDAQQGFLDTPGFADNPGFTGHLRLPDELTAQPDASGARIDRTPADQATPGLPRHPGPAPRPEPQPGHAALGPTLNSSAPEPEPREAVPRPESGDTAPGPWPRQAASRPAHRTRASDGDPGDIGHQSVRTQAGTSAAMSEYLVTDPDKEAVARSGAAAGARTARSGASDGWPAAPGQAPVPVDWGRADVSAHPDLKGNPFSPPHTVAGHQPALDRAGAESGSARQGPVRRAPGEPWRIPRLRQAQPARDGTVTSAVSPRPGTASVSGPEATATPSGTSYSVQRSSHDPAGPPPTRHGAGSPSAPPPAAAPPARTDAAGTQASVTPPGASPAHRAAGPELGGNATGLSGDRLSGDRLSSVPHSAARAAEPQVPGTRQPSTPGLSPLLPPGAGRPGAPVTATSNSGPPLADSLRPGELADARAEASAPSAVPLGDARPPATPTPAAQPPAALLPAVRPLAAQSPAAPRPAAHRPAASPPAAPRPAAQQPAASPPAPRTSSAPPPAVSAAGAAEMSPRPPVTDRAQGRLTPAGHSARPPGNRAEAPARPSAPTLSIGTIEVTLLPPPPTATPARPARREPPQRLSRGLGRRFGQGQA